jgi:putative membrane protein
VSTLIWIVPLTVGVAVSSVTGLHAGANEFIFGAFLVWGFECIVINGAFVKSTLVSLVLGAIHPLSVLLVALSTGGYAYTLPALTGILALGAMLAFLTRLKGLRTKQGIPAPHLLQAFLRTWAGHEPGELEGYFSKYAKTETVATDIVLAESKEKRVAFVLPGIHPGPFYPVGSYNLSELVYRSLRAKGVSPVVLHGTGGHERNTPTNELAAAYADQISQFAGSLSLSEKSLMRGPARDRVGITNITTLAFGREVMSIISNSPFLSDDLDPKTTAEALGAASKLGLRLSMVDAHNSVDGESRPQTQITADEWEAIFTRVLAMPEREFRIGFASSTEMNLKLGPDVSEGGVSVTVFADDDGKSALVSADSNNALSGLRERIAEELKKNGVGFIELCTSDTHNFAARNLSDRGYLALGEGSSTDDVVNTVRKLVNSAASNIVPCTLTTARLETVTSLIGSESLDDFAGLTREAIALSKTYVKVILPAVLLLTAITLFY